MDIKNKYLKYKNKYIRYEKNLYGGMNDGTDYQPNHIVCNLYNDIGEYVIHIDIMHLYGTGHYVDDLPEDQYPPEQIHPYMLRNITYKYTIKIYEDRMLINYYDRIGNNIKISDIKLLSIIKEEFTKQINSLVDDEDMVVDSIRMIINYIKSYNKYLNENYPEHSNYLCRLSLI